MGQQVLHEGRQPGYPRLRGWQAEVPIRAGEREAPVIAYRIDICINRNAQAFLLPSVRIRFDTVSLRGNKMIEDGPRYDWSSEGNYKFTIKVVRSRVRC